MSFSDLIKKLRQTAGNAASWVGDKAGIPEMNLSERIAGGATKDYNKVMAAGDDSGSGGGGAGAGGADDGLYLVGDKTGAGTGGTGTGGNGGGGAGVKIDPIKEDGTVKSLQEIEEEKRANAIRAARANLEILKQRVQQMKDSAGGIRDTTLGVVKENYDKLKGLAVQKRTSSIGDLQASDTNTQNLYGKLGGNTRRAMESALTRNRVLARAMGLGGSSFYKDSQDNTTNEGMNSINDSLEEEAAKRAAIQNQIATTGKEYDVNDQSIAGEEKTLNLSANDAYNNTVNNADTLMATGYNDEQLASGNAETNFNSGMEGIKQYLQNIGLAKAASGTSSTTGAGATFLNAYKPTTDTLSNTLNDNSSIDRNNKYIATAKDANPYNNTGAGGAANSDTNGNYFNALLNNVGNSHKEYVGTDENGKPKWIYR